MALSKPAPPLKTCATPLSQSIGLMFSRKKICLFILKKPKRISLHNWFVFYPLTIYFFNKNKQLIEKKEKFLPFSFYTSKKPAQYVLEIPFSWKDLYSLQQLRQFIK